jgi:hypothetical protein
MRLADYGGRLVCRRIEKRKYRFVWGDDIADLEIANGQRVSEAKIVVADYWNSMPELITLYCRGRKLRDRAILSLMRIPPDNRICVYIRDAGLVYLRSHPDVVVRCDQRLTALDELSRWIYMRI